MLHELPVPRSTLRWPRSSQARTCARAHTLVRSIIYFGRGQVVYVSVINWLLNPRFRHRGPAACHVEWGRYKATGGALKPVPRRVLTGSPEEQGQSWACPVTLLECTNQKRLPTFRGTEWGSGEARSVTAMELPPPGWIYWGCFFLTVKLLCGKELGALSSVSPSLADFSCPFLNDMSITG